MIHFVRVANWGPNAQTIHNGQVIGLEESQPKFAGSEPEPGRAEKVLQQLEPTLGKTLSPKERREALESLHEFSGIFKPPGKLMGWTEWVQHTIDVRLLRKVPIHRRALVEVEPSVHKAFCTHQGQFHPRSNASWTRSLKDSWERVAWSI